MNKETKKTTPKRSGGIVGNLKKKIEVFKKRQQERKEANRKEMEAETLLDCFKIGGIFVGIAILSGFLYMKNIDKSPKIILERPDVMIFDEKQKITVYYPSVDGLKKEETEILKLSNSTKVIDKTLREVLAKLETMALIPYMDYDKEILFYRQGTKVYVDVPEKMFNNIGNPKQELEVIYSLVNSLTNINGVDSVRILIDNIEIEKVKYANLKKDYTFINKI